MIDVNKRHRNDGRNDKLGNAHAPGNFKRLTAMINQNNFNFSPIVTVNRAGRI